MSFSEIAGVATIGSFMALVGDQSILQGESMIATIYHESGATNPQDFVFIAGLGVLLVLIISTTISIITVWRLAHFSSKVGVEIGDRLYQHYIHQKWLFHASGNSAQLTKNIATEATRVTNQIINPLMQMNAKVIMAFFMLSAVFIFNPTVAIIILIIVSTAYFLLYKLVRIHLKKGGGIISDAHTQRYKLMAEGFGGIKDILLLGCHSSFIFQFKRAGEKLAQSQSEIQTIKLVPRYFMELIAFSTIIFLVLYLVKRYQGDLSLILPILSVYALAGFKLLPAFQQIYSSVASIKGGMASFEAIRQDLYDSVQFEHKQKGRSGLSNVEQGKQLPLKTAIELKDVNFTYPNKQEPAIQSVNIRIPVNQVIGIVGASGSGKSTIIDLLLGLIRPEKGALIIDGQPITQKQTRCWQNSLGYVPQSIFLADASIQENIAFGLPIAEIDLECICRAINLSHLDELIKQLPDGIETRVGERGVQLSGGQRQRIGIARALYHDADILIFDEATSALDGITEKLIMDAIHDFSEKKTIILIAHRLKTVQKCDIIYLLEKGRVIDHGTFEELENNNDFFKKMAEHA
jgi:HlyD family secretion protein